MSSIGYVTMITTAIAGELWLPITHHPKYVVSNLGRVKRFYTSTIPRILQQSQTQSGYFKVSLSQHSKIIQKYVHILVLEAFVGSAPTSKHEGDHIDGHKENNKITNLEWVTREENIRRAWAMGLYPTIRGEDTVISKLTEEQVLYIRSSNNTNAKLSRLFDVSESTIHAVQTRKTWIHV